MPSAGRLSMRDYLNGPSCVIVSIYWRTPATILPMFYKQMLPKIRVLWQEGALKVKYYTLSQQSCLLHYDDHFIPCFLIIPLCMGLRWCFDAVIIFLIYLSIHISTFKHLKQNKWLDKWQNQSSMLPSTKTLLYDAFGLQCSFLRLLSKTTHLCAYNTNRIVAGVLQSIEINKYNWLVITLSQSALFKPKTFSYRMVVLE